MTKPRTSPHRELYGFIGTAAEARPILKAWNARFREEGTDASMDFYPTTEQNLPERLSEMFHFDRRAYVVGRALRKAILPLLDAVERAGQGRGVGVIMNDGGVLRGCTSFATLDPCATPSSKKQS